MKTTFKKRIRQKRRDLRLLRVCGGLLIFMIFSIIILPLTLVKCSGGGVNISISDSDSQRMAVTVYRQNDGKTVDIELEEYVAGVVAGEMPSSFEMEALKAQAVAARTYGISKARRGAEHGNSAEHFSAPLCDGTHCQVYRNEKELREIKGDKWMKDGWLKIKSAVEATAGQMMYYNGELVEQPLFHSSCGGKTENSEDVFVSALPYLRSVDSPFEEEAPHYSENVSVSMKTFKNKIRESFGADNINSKSIKIIERSIGGGVQKIQVGNKVLTGRDIRSAFGLRSSDFSFSFDGSDNIVFTTRGYGHGVGMSQWGANGMAKAGYDYAEILGHYYLDITIK